MSLDHHICQSASHIGIVLSKYTVLLVSIQPKQPHYGCCPIKDRAFSQLGKSQRGIFPTGANPPNTAKPPEAIIPNQARSKQSQESKNLAPKTSCKDPKVIMAYECKATTKLANWFLPHQASAIEHSCTRQLLCMCGVFCSVCTCLASLAH